MTDLRRIAFRLKATVNDFEFEMNGHGVGDRAEGTCELHLSAAPRFPAGFDPVSCPMVCSHPTSLFFAATPPGLDGLDGLTECGYSVDPPREGLIYDAAGTLLMHLSVTGTVTVDGATVVSTHQMSGFSRLPRIVRTITPFDDYLLPGPAGTTTAVARYSLLTETGAVLDGITTVPYRWTSPRPLTVPIARRVESIDVDWDGGPAVHAYYRTSLRAMTTSDEIVSAVS
jgi:hypothetical protein